MLKVFYTEEALGDLDRIGIWGIQEFGVEAVDRYAHLIDFTVEYLRENPSDVGVKPSHKGYSKYHLSMRKDDVSFAGKIVKKPRHLIFFKVIEDTLYISRILRDNQDTERHL